MERGRAKRANLGRVFLASSVCLGFAFGILASVAVVASKPLPPLTVLGLVLALTLAGGLFFGGVVTGSYYLLTRYASVSPPQFGRRGPGAVRRDCEPHRGRWLRGFGLLSILMSLGSFLFALLAGAEAGLMGGLRLVGAVSCVLVLPFLAGASLGLTVWAQAGRDLDKMRAGLMDPEGEVSTRLGRRYGFLGAFLSAAGLLSCGLLYGGLALLERLPP